MLTQCYAASPWRWRYLTAICQYWASSRIAVAGKEMILKVSSQGLVESQRLIAEQEQRSNEEAEQKAEKLRSLGINPDEL